MNNSIKFLIPLIIFGVLAMLLFFGLHNDPRALSSMLINKPTPDFSRPNLLNTDELVTQEVLRDGVTLINVWGTWCVSCRKEHGELVRLSQQEGVKIVGFNWRDERSDALRYLQMFGNPYHIIAMVGETDPLVLDWGVTGAPETFIIDSKGTIRYKHIGPITEGIWNETLKPIVKQIEAES